MDKIYIFIAENKKITEYKYNFIASKIFMVN